MVSTFKTISDYDGNDWGDLLNDLNVLSVFDGILSIPCSADETSGIIKYIVWTYSVESDKVQFERDWYRCKQKVFQLSGLDVEWYQKTVELEDATILHAINKWVEYQDDDIFEQLITLKDLRAEMRRSCLSPIMKATGIDYDQKFKNAQYSVELMDRIKELEAKLISRDSKFREAIDEIKTASKKKYFGIEKIAK